MREWISFLEKTYLNAQSTRRSRYLLIIGISYCSCRSINSCVSIIISIKLFNNTAKKVLFDGITRDLKELYITFCWLFRHDVYPERKAHWVSECRQCNYCYAALLGTTARCVTGVFHATSDFWLLWLLSDCPKTRNEQSKSWIEPPAASECLTRCLSPWLR